MIRGERPGWDREEGTDQGVVDSVGTGEERGGELKQNPDHEDLK